MLPSRRPSAIVAYRALRRGLAQAIPQAVQPTLVPVLLHSFLALALATGPEHPQIEPEDYALSAALFLASGAAIFLAPEPPAGWKQNLLFDESWGEALRAKTPGQERFATITSDILQNGLLLYPLLDALGAGLFKDNGWPLALSMSISTLEAYAVATLIINVTKRVIGRVRPDVRACEGTEDDYSCRSRAGRRALLSGHATASFAAAGATCVHHRHTRLYGSPLLDNLACAATLALAIGGSLARVSADVHYATDVVLSGALGLLVGYGVPELLHYRPPRAADPRRLNGDLSIFAIAGVGQASPRGSAGRRTVATGGGGISLRHFIWLSEVGLLADGDPGVGIELGADGLLLRSTPALFVERGRGHVQLWLSHLALGWSIEVRTLRAEQQRQSLLLSGPTASLGTLDPKLPIALFARWLPLMDGDVKLFSAGLSVSALDYLHLRLEVLPLSRSGALALLSTGGRLPW